MSTNKDSRCRVRGIGIRAGVGARISLLILCLLLVSCGAQTRIGQEKRDIRLIDEAFALVLPVTAARISGDKNTGFLPVADIEASTAKLVELWAAKGSAVPKAVIASPLVAKNIDSSVTSLDASAKLRMPIFVLPFGKAPKGGNDGVRIVAYDYRHAYAAMGEEAARLVRKATDKSEGGAICGILFQENFMRDRGALEAFTEAFAQAFEPGAAENLLVVDRLESEELKLDPVGAARSAALALASKRGMAVVVLAFDDASAAESATSEAPEGILFMADMSAWGDGRPARGRFAYGIKGDEKRLARAINDLSRDIAEGKKVAPVREVRLRFGRLFPGIF